MKITIVVTLVLTVILIGAAYLLRDRSADERGIV